MIKDKTSTGYKQTRWQSGLHVDLFTATMCCSNSESKPKGMKFYFSFFMLSTCLILVLIRVLPNLSVIIIFHYIKDIWLHVDLNLRH